MDLLIFNNIINDDVIKNIINKNFICSMRGIIKFSETEGVTENGVTEYIVSTLANDENILSTIGQAGMCIGQDLYDSAFKDLDKIYNELLKNITFTYKPSNKFDGFSSEYTNSIKTLSNITNAKQLLDNLIIHYKTLGSGILSKYIAFKYDGQIKGISSVDKLTFDDLVGLDYQKQTLLENTSAFVKGRRANNVLLFGDRGTGKSSSVKALLNTYHKDGLRMIEMPKQNIKDIPYLSKELSQKPHKYIIFLDDLSFESHETDYRALKIAMDGQLQSNPKNVLIFATSNRKHLIKENWSDREGSEVHVNDNIQETLSLSERFGISLVFSAPSSQKEYLKIVSELLRKCNIDITPEIEKSAIVWQMNFGGRSGRCANQFVSSYVSKLN